MILPDAPWRSRDGLAALISALGGGASARFVGGAVRDTLLGIAVADIDVATTHPPDRVLERLKDAGIRSVPTGIAHGTITAILESGPVEVTTLRRDVETDGRHAVVAFTDDWKADASRRDFTMNALYAAPEDGRIFDYFGGLADLAARRVRFIGDPLRRIAEDHLRILRFFRFLARFGDEPDAEGLSACIARANDLMALSRERIAEELLKLLVAPGVVDVVALMIGNGVLKPVLPEIGSAGAERLKRCVASEAGADLEPDPVRRLCALLPREAAVAEAVAARLKLSNARRKRIARASGEIGGNPRAVAYRFGTETALDRIILDPQSHASSRDIEMLAQWPVPRFPLKGGMLVERGIGAGPQVAALLRGIEDRWIEEGFPDAGRVDQLADEMTAQALRCNSNS